MGSLHQKRQIQTLYVKFMIFHHYMWLSQKYKKYNMVMGTVSK